jgi:hypothetical protein
VPDQALLQSSVTGSALTRCSEDEPADKRRQNREFMRRWRANPVHLAAEQARRRERYYAVQKQRGIERMSRSPQTRERDRKLCGLCSKRLAVRNIARLQVSDASADGYVKVVIPYCGHC